MVAREVRSVVGLAVRSVQSNRDKLEACERLKEFRRSTDVEVDMTEDGDDCGRRATVYLRVDYRNKEQEPGRCSWKAEMEFFMISGTVKGPLLYTANMKQYCTVVCCTVQKLFSRLRSYSTYGEYYLR